jgi:hypothetical protein
MVSPGSAGDDEAQDRSKWRGTNWLGEVLDQVRRDILAGSHTTEDFRWSGQLINVFPVRIINERNISIWIWDHDKIKRWASELANEFDGLSGSIDVLVCEDEKLDVIVEMQVIRNGKKLYVKASQPEGSKLLEVFKDALQNMKNLLRDKC